MNMSRNYSLFFRHLDASPHGQTLINRTRSSSLLVTWGSFRYFPSLGLSGALLAVLGRFD